MKHGGFGIGLERTVAWICGLPHVRETIPYPRMIYSSTHKRSQLRGFSATLSWKFLP